MSKLLALKIGPGDIIGQAPVTITNAGSSHVSSIMSQAFLIFTWVVGVVSIFSFLVAGFHYITAGGDTEKAATARRQIVYSVIGILIASSTFLIYNAARTLAESATSSSIETNL